MLALPVATMITDTLVPLVHRTIAVTRVAMMKVGGQRAVRRRRRRSWHCDGDAFGSSERGVQSGVRECEDDHVCCWQIVRLQVNYILVYIV